METKTQTANVIELSSGREKYDNEMKKLLSNKPILAWVLKSCTDEFANYDLRFIENCIEGKVDVSTKAMNPNEPDRDKNITGDNTEDVSLGEQTIYYDIRFSACIPGDNPVYLIINVEAQKDASPSYPIEWRAIYYCCRLISAQYGTVFTNQQYDELRKVYSIWFCTNPPEKNKNRIKKVLLHEEEMYGELVKCKKGVDLIQAVIVYLGGFDDVKDNAILRLMNVLTDVKVPIDERKRILAEDFRIPMTREIEREVSTVSSLGQGVFEKGYVEGEQSGFDKGGKSKEKEIAIRLYKNGCNKQFILNNIDASEEELDEWLSLATEDNGVSKMNFLSEV